ncbi:hypothetical protein ANN_03360 [Periplaneta americana]|uniref:Uncharacterized protein n=1 Tax=Periplaneta americana TaxID=6978 RepID=A0ABQ8U0L2_PERAM|nr:hypothetical protein ANN_03360 [Periplaneta americana]
MSIAPTKFRKDAFMIIVFTQFMRLICDLIIPGVEIGFQKDSHTEFCCVTNQFFFIYRSGCSKSVLKKHGDGRRTCDEMVANVQAPYERSPRKSSRRISGELQVPKSTLQRIVHKRLKMYAYKVQLMQHLEPDDKPKRVEFTNTMLDRLGADPDFMSKIFFSNEAMFHVSDKVNRHNVRIWERIIEAIESIPEKMLQLAWQEIVHRLDIVTVTARAHVEIW